MSVSQRPPGVDLLGQAPPKLACRPPGPQSRSWMLRYASAAAPMGPRPEPLLESALLHNAPPGIVLSVGRGSNVCDVDGNRYVDLAGGFGSLLLGHAPEGITRVLHHQSERLWQALGDVYPSDAKIGLVTRLSELAGEERQVILGQSGSDAVSAAIKTATLATGRPGVIAFSGAYHGLSYGPLSALGLRASYREPFCAQLNPHVTFVDYPNDPSSMDQALHAVEAALKTGSYGGIVVEPILGRGGVVVPPGDFIPGLGNLARQHRALLIADEVWTGLGRAGEWLFSVSDSYQPDLICLGKGLGGGMPISALLGRPDVMAHWAREQEVVETSTFAGAPLAAACALALIDNLSRQRLVPRAQEVGERFKKEIDARLAPYPGLRVRGAGLMLAIDLNGARGDAVTLQRALLQRGYVTTTGGGQRDVLVLTPPLNIEEALLMGFVDALSQTLKLL